MAPTRILSESHQKMDIFRVPVTSEIIFDTVNLRVLFSAISYKQIKKETSFSNIRTIYSIESLKRVRTHGFSRLILAALGQHHINHQGYIIHSSREILHTHTQTTFMKI